MKALHTTPSPNSDAKEKHNVVEDVIASDMTAYDSPMTSLDRRTLEKAKLKESLSAAKSPLQQPKIGRTGDRNKKQKEN